MNLSVRKRIAGVMHVRRRCSICKGMCWTQAAGRVRDVVGRGYVCDTCVKFNGTRVAQGRDSAALAKIERGG